MCAGAALLAGRVYPRDSSTEIGGVPEGLGVCSWGCAVYLSPQHPVLQKGGAGMRSRAVSLALPTPLAGLGPLSKREERGVRTCGDRAVSLVGACLPPLPPPEAGRGA